MIYYLLLAIHSLAVFSQTIAVDEDSAINIAVRNDYRKECLEISQFVERDYNIQCHYNYHHFNSSAYRNRYDRNKAIQDGKVRIAGFNLLHPGMSSTRYKDYRRLAQVINQFDVVASTELLPLVSDDLRNNQQVVRFLKDAPEEIEKLRQQIRDESARSRPSSAKLQEYTAKLKSLEDDLTKAKDLYRKPGYLRVLHALRELKDGKDWALLLSPRGEGARATDVQEMVGYFYRASKVKPKVNQYCREIRTAGAANPVACIPNMGKDILGENKRDMFSRRPFLAEFISGNFSFALLASHVVFTSPTDQERRELILRQAFGVSDYRDLGVGINASNYARFAEVKVMLDFMREIRSRFNQKDIILVGDLNLEYNNPFWETTLAAFPGGKLYVTDKTTVSERRYNADGSETHGVANDYDHFIFDEEVTSECRNEQGVVDAKAYDFYSGRPAGNLRNAFRVRKPEMEAGRYVKDESKYERVERLYITPYKTGEMNFDTIGTKTLRVGNKNVRVRGIVPDQPKVDKYIAGFYDRVMNSQFENDSYYRYFKELLSDHKPIYMDCSTR